MISEVAHGSTKSVRGLQHGANRFRILGQALPESAELLTFADPKASLLPNDGFRTNSHVVACVFAMLASVYRAASAQGLLK